MPLNLPAALASALLLTLFIAASSVAADTVIEEIVVTAQKREQSVQDVPISIAAFTGDNLQERGIENLEQLQYATPGLSFSQTNGASFIYVRGVGSDIIGLGDSSVAFNVDGIYFGRPESALIEFNDIERIEVLRGPQGTLYGRNATGGSINVITKSPTQKLDAGASLTYGNYDKTEFQGAVSGPLTDVLLGRAAVRFSRRDGFIDNRLSGAPLHTDFVQGPLPYGLSDPLLAQKGSLSPENLGDEEVTSFIGKLQWIASERAEITFSADYTLDEDNGPNLKPLASEGLVFDLGATHDLDLYNAEINEGVFEKQESFGASAVLDLYFGQLSLKSITAYREFTNDSLLDSDGDDLRGVDFLQDLDQDQLTQEFQLTGATDRLEWLGGFFYLHETSSWNGRVFSAFGPPANSPPIPRGVTPAANIIFEFRSALETDVWAIFGEASYDLTDRLTVVAGARYSWEEKGNVTSTPDSIGAFGLSEPLMREEDWDAFTPKLGLEYNLKDDLLLYTTVSRGFKSGGYNSTATAPNQLAPFDPEFIWAYEAGWKGVFVNGQVQFNGSAFYYDYTDLQVLAFTGFASASIENAAEAENYGGEVEMIYRPNDRLALLLTGAYLKAEYTDYFADGAQIGQPAVAIDLSGNTIRNSPEWSFNGAIDYDLPMDNGGVLNFRAEGNFKSEVFFDQFNQPILSEGDLLLANARVAYILPNDQWEISAFVRNLTDEEYIVGAVGLPAQNNAPQGYAGDPRTYGVRVSFAF